MNKILIGTLSGMVAGVAIGLLTAPASGTETRQNLAKQANKLKKKLNKLRGKVEDEMDELEDVFAHEIDGLTDDVRQKVLQMIETRKKGKMPEPSLS